MVSVFSFLTIYNSATLLLPSFDIRIEREQGKLYITNYKNERIYAKFVFFFVEYKRSYMC